MSSSSSRFFSTSLVLSSRCSFPVLSWQNWYHLPTGCFLWLGPFSGKHSNQPDSHQQLFKSHSHGLSSPFRRSLWTSAGRLRHVHSPECVEFPDACVCLSPAFQVTCLPSHRICYPSWLSRFCFVVVFDSSVWSDWPRTGSSSCGTCKGFR